MRALDLRFDATRPHIAIGLMSGTSHDGISAALVRIDTGREPPVQLITFKTYRYPAKFRTRLLEAAADPKLGISAVAQLNVALGEVLARAAIAIAKEGGTTLNRVSFIGSHGHTFFHLPPRTAKRGETPATLQLGETATIAAISGLPVVGDLRPMDIALGGEGAPLAPLAHLWLFGDAKRGRIIQNIGGIGNATWLPPRAKAAQMIAFDTGPGNMLIDAATAHFSEGKLTMDRDGQIAASGAVNTALLAELMRHPYFRRRPPKSTGREEFGQAYFDQVRARADELGLDGPALIATLTALTARSIAEACRRFVLPLGRADQLIATGGGSRNPTLMRMLMAELPELEVIAAEGAGVNGDALEAIAFALLGYQTLSLKPGNIPSVTGAKSPAILGKITLPPSYR
jgi:anhydro-N-acetylmuramic acid kinase